MTWRARIVLGVAALPLLAAVWLACEAWSLPRTGEIRAQLFTRRVPPGQGTWIPLWSISPKLRTAVVIWEDPAFFHHSGLDLPEIGRAAWRNLRAGGYRRGASTITQQVVKNLFLGPEKTMRRKVREAILAGRLERALSKEEILTVYLNIAEWGDNIAGAEAASRRYFDKPASDLTWAEAALLAGILPNPRRWNPCSAPEQANKARHAVLTKLVDSQTLSQQEFVQADAAPAGGCHSSTPPAMASGVRSAPQVLARSTLGTAGFITCRAGLQACCRGFAWVRLRTAGPIILLRRRVARFFRARPLSRRYSGRRPVIGR